MPINNRTSISAKLFTIICLIFGLFLYKPIDMRGFSYIDELIALSLAFYLVVSMLSNNFFETKMLNAFYVFAGIFFFYFVYSWLLGINPNGITTSFVVHIKPFLTFFSVYLIGIYYDNRFKKTLSKLVFILSVGCLIVALTGNIYPFFGHPAYMAMTVTCLALFYYFLTPTSFKNTITSIFIMAIALLSFRMKAVGFFILFVMVVLFYKGEIKFKFSIRNTLLLILSILFILYKAKDKLDFYLFNPYYENNLEGSGRAALYVTAPQILSDYFPLGSGFGTYADIGSAISYSPLYYKYQLNYVFGLSPENNASICDTFFPDLVQFGFVGVFLFFYFWYWIFSMLKNNYHKTKNTKLFKIGILIIAYFMIESTSATTFVQSQGMMTMFLLALVLYEGKYIRNSI